MKVNWTDTAEGDLDAQVRFVARDNVDAAIELEDRVLGRVAGLADNPKMGRPGRVPGTRELVIVGTPYLAVYEATGSLVVILRLLHGAQLWPPRSKKRTW